jgi:DNA-binding NarL/FixJ family response regulator
MNGASVTGAASLQGVPVTVLIVEDDPCMRDEFVVMILATPGLELQGAEANLAGARARLASGRVPDVLIVDLGLPDGDGTELIAELAARGAPTSVLVATVFGDEAHVIRAIEAGAHGYLLKDTSLDEFASAIEMVYRGGSPLSPQIARHLLKRFTAPLAKPAIRQPARAGADALERLTTREAEILTLIARGHTVAEVAKFVHLSAHTVTTHVKNMYAKLAVNNRIQAVNRARATGQIE